MSFIENEALNRLLKEKEKNKELQINIINAEATPYISYDILDNEEFCTAGMSTRLGGVSKGCFESMNLGFTRGDKKEDVYQNFVLLGKSAGFTPEDVCLPNQCHLSNVRVVTEKDRGSGILTSKIEEPYDAQITNVPGIVLITYGADCDPLYFSDSEHKCVGLAHAGWRGTRLNIAEATLKAMKEQYGTEPSKVKAVIGPSICQNCYEVSADVANEFKGYSSKVFRQISEEKFLLNLWQANKENLLSAGVPEENIVVSGLCTKCYHELLFSHRYHHDQRGANAAFIFVKDR